MPATADRERLHSSSWAMRQHLSDARAPPDRPSPARTCREEPDSAARAASRASAATSSKCCSASEAHPPVRTSCSRSRTIDAESPWAAGWASLASRVGARQRSLIATATAFHA